MLDVSFNQLRRLHGTLSNSTHLREVNASNNQLDQLPSLSGCSSLAILDVSNNRIPAANLAAASSLQIVNLRNNALTSLPQLPSTSELHTVQLAFNNLCGPVSAEQLLSLPGLGVLELSGKQMYDMCQHIRNHSLPM